MAKILVINGSNMNLLGIREPEIYGTTSLADIEKMLRERAKKDGIDIEFLQSNHEGVILDAVAKAMGSVDVMILNPAGFTNTSISIRDAIKGVMIPTIEVHLSNLHTREEWRKDSVISGAAKGIVMGFGYVSYILAYEGAKAIIEGKVKN